MLIVQNCSRLIGVYCPCWYCLPSSNWWQRWSPDVRAPSQQCSLMLSPLGAALSSLQQHSWHTTLLLFVRMDFTALLHTFCKGLACFNFLRIKSLCCAFLTSWEMLVDHVSCTVRVTPRYLRLSTVSTISPWMWSGRFCFLTPDPLKSIIISFVFEVFRARSLSLQHSVRWSTARL